MAPPLDAATGVLRLMRARTRCSRRPTWSLAGVVLVIVTGLLLLVKGETKFDGTGFALVMTASCMSGLRFTLTQVGRRGRVLEL
jgi:hypothetical protein